MPPVGIVPPFNEVEHLPLRLGLRAEPLPLKQLALQRGEEALATKALSKQSPTDPMEGRTPAALHRSPKAIEVYCVP